MQQGINREQLWAKLSQLDPFQQQSVAAFIDSLLKPQTPAPKRSKQELLALSVWSDEDLAQIEADLVSWPRSGPSLGAHPLA